MTESIYKEYQNKYYNPNDNDKKPGDNDNWKSIQKGFHDISTTQLETSAGLTLGKGTEDEVSITPKTLSKVLKTPKYMHVAEQNRIAAGTNVTQRTPFVPWFNRNKPNAVVAGDSLDPNTKYKVLAIIAPFVFGDPNGMLVLYSQPLFNTASGNWQDKTTMPVFETDDNGDFVMDTSTTMLYTIRNTNSVSFDETHWVLLYFFPIEE